MAATPEIEVPSGDAPQRLDPRSVTVGRIGGWIVVCILAGLTLPGSLVALVVNGGLGPSFATVAALALIAGAGGLAHAAPTWHYRYTWYRVDADGIEIGRGRFWQRLITVPHARVQHIDVVRGPLERRFGLATLIIYTAGHAHSDVKVEGLSHEAALGLRERLVKEKGLDAV
jgi:membrane protein YdbS with pleckstrin-like domain